MNWPVGLALKHGFAENFRAVTGRGLCDPATHMDGICVSCAGAARYAVVRRDARRPVHASVLGGFHGASHGRDSSARLLFRAGVASLPAPWPGCAPPPGLAGTAYPACSVKILNGGPA